MALEWEGWVQACWESHSALPLPERDRGRAPDPSVDGCEAALTAEAEASASDRDLARIRHLRPHHFLPPGSCAWEPWAEECESAVGHWNLTPYGGKRANRSGRRDKHCCWD